MNFIGIEEIQVYKNKYQYKVFEYDDVIEIGNKEKYICDLTFIKLEIEDIYIEKGFEENVAYAIVENLNEKANYSLEEINQKIKDFIINEIPLVKIDKGSINVVFSLKK